MIQNRRAYQLIHCHTRSRRRAGAAAVCGAACGHADLGLYHLLHRGGAPLPDSTQADRAALAALLHDSAKEISKDEMCAIMQAHPEYAEGGEARPTPVWHGICAAILARTEWGVTDEAVLSAIACHTAGKAGMTQLDKILYLADMTSAERDWPGVEKLRKLEMKDLDAAMLAALRQTNGFVLSEGKPLDPESKAAYEDILAHSGQNEG